MRELVRKLICDGCKKAITDEHPWNLEIISGGFVTPQGLRALDFHGYACIKKFFESKGDKI